MQKVSERLSKMSQLLGLALVALDVLMILKATSAKETGITFRPTAVPMVSSAGR